MSRAAGRHTRPKKLNAKQNVQIFREDQVELIDYDAIRGNIETGVEKNEESEYHLQQAIKASEAAKADAKVKDAYIPTPPTIASGVNYDLLYFKSYRLPVTYIRSSSTVEDCAGTPYCMDEEDDVALKSINAGLSPGQAHCTEDQFEEVMSFFEETAQSKQPFAAVDNPPVLPLEELEEQYDETTPPYVRTFAKLIYEHWKGRRSETGNRGLAPRLKFETGQDSDDADPYICFRRRELRQIRKTRNRDAQSAEKLRRLRHELEAARTILQLVRSRESKRKDLLEIDRQVFEQRLKAKETKRTLGIKGDDEDFVNQKPSAKRPHLSPGHPGLAQQFRGGYPLIRGGVPGDDLRTLEDHQMQRQEAIKKDIDNNIEKHIRWNEGYVDKTKTPLTPGSEMGYTDRSTEFLPAIPTTEYLPTPPASVSDEEIQDVDVTDVEKEDLKPAVSVRYASPAEGELGKSMPSFRRRIGRGGRMMIDRRMPFRSKQESRPVVKVEKFKYDSDDSDLDESTPADEADIFHTMQYRSHLFGRVRDSEAVQAQAARRAQMEAGEPSQAGQTSSGQQGAVA